MYCTIGNEAEMNFFHAIIIAALIIIICMCAFALVYPDASEEVSHILAKKLMGNGETRDSHDREQTESSSSSPSSWTRKESLNQLLKLEQMSKVPKLKGEVRIFSSAPKN